METEMGEISYSKMDISSRPVDVLNQETNSYNRVNINRISRCSSCQVSYHQICRYLLLVILFSWYLLLLIGMVKTSYVQERKLCPYSEFWTFVGVSLIVDSLIIWFSYRDIWSQENHTFPYLPISQLSKIGIKCFCFSIWGTLIFYSFSCTDKLNRTPLFWVSLYQYLFNIVLGSLLGLLSLKRYVEKDTYPETTEEEIQDLAQQLGRVDNFPPSGEPVNRFSYEV